MENNYIQKARTIASFVKKNKHLFKESSNELAQFLYQELSKCNNKVYDTYIYRLDNVEIQFILIPEYGKGREGGCLYCDVKNIFRRFSKLIFTSDIDAITYYQDGFIEDKGKLLFDWDKIIESMERCIKDMEEDC
jgi:hypothetical protein